MLNDKKSPSEDFDYKILFENLTDAIFIHTFDGEFLTVNKSAERRLGYSYAELLKIKVSDIDSETNKRLFEKRIRELKEKGKLIFEGEHIAKDGRIIPGEMHVQIIEFSGKPAILSIVRDITKEKRYESLLELEANYSQTIVDLAPIILIVLDKEGIIIDANDYLCELTGFKKEDIIGKNWFSTFIPSSDQPDIKKLFTKAIGGISTVGNVNPINTVKKDTFRMVKWFDRLLHGYKGRKDVMLAVGVDITKELEAEKEIRLHSQYLNSVRESIIVTNLDRKVIYWGKGAEHLYGYTSDEVLGKKIDFVINSDEVKEEEERLEIVLKEGIWKGQYWQNKKDDTRFLADTSITLIRDDDGNPIGFIGIDRDITQESENQKAIEQQRNELGKFAQIMNHDLRNLFSLIINYTDMLEEAVESPYTQKIRDVIKRIDTILMNSYNLAKAGKIIKEKTPINLKKSISNAAEIIISNDIKFKCSDLPIVIADSDKLFQVFKNMFENAIVHGQASEITIDYEISSKHLILKIQNNGRQIRQIVIDKILKRTTEGLGMAVIFRILDALNWNLELESQKEQTTFKILIPKSDIMENK